MSAAFFYGTLMHPKILKRVIQNEGAHLQICPAVLLEYTRHKVKWRDYPGAIPYTQGRLLIKRELELEERSVRGTLVTGLTKSDLVLLDDFEGDEYTRQTVDVHPLGALVALSVYDLVGDETLIPSKPPPLSVCAGNLFKAVQAETYVYIDSKMLKPDLWFFEDFLKEAAWKWYRQPGPDEEDARWAEGIADHE